MSPAPDGVATAPLASDAIRLRVGWRLAAGDPALAREAVALLDPLIAASPLGSDWVLRARAVAAAGDAPAAFATLHEAVKAIHRERPRRKLAWEALLVLESLPEGTVEAAERDRLERRLRQLSR